MKQSTILITGAGGFLGSHLAKRLHGENVILTSRTPHNDRQIRALDLLDAGCVSQAISSWKPNIVFHIGAVVNLSRDYDTAKKTLETNIFSTINVLEALRYCPPDLFVLASTEEVYGDSPVPYREDMTPRPPSPYAISKVASEQLCRMYANELQFPCVMFRIGTIFGPMQTLSRFIPTIIRQAIKGEDILLNSGEKSRDYIYIDDVVDACMLTKERVISENTLILNVGGGTSTRLIDVVQLIKKATKSTSRVQVGKIPERVAESDTWSMDITKAHDILGWSPKVTLAEGIQRTCDYFVHMKEPGL